MPTALFKINSRGGNNTATLSKILSIGFGKNGMLCINKVLFPYLCRDQNDCLQLAFLLKIHSCNLLMLLH